MVLPVITLLLVVMSWFGWQSIYSGVLSYQTVATSQRATQQFLLAEYALLRAEQWLQAMPAKKIPTATTWCYAAPCILVGQQARYLPDQPAFWWQATGNSLTTPVTLDVLGEQLAFYAIEHLTDANTPATSFYRITAWALLAGETKPTILQSVWRKPSRPVFAALEQRYAWRQW